MKYNAALFDMDGVLTDTEPLHELAFRVTLETYGYNLTSADYEKYFLGNSDIDGLALYFKAMNQKVDIPKLAQEKARVYPQIANEHLTAYPDIVQLVKDLSQQIPLALVTGSLRFEAETALSKLGITDCFKVIVATEDVHEGKPDPEGYLKAASLLSVSIDECVVIEDSISGITAAKASGATCIAVTNTKPAEALTAADYVVNELILDLF